MNLKSNFALLFLFVSAIASAQEEIRQRPTWYVGTFVGQSAIILGSQDMRQGGGFAVSYEKPEPRFRLGKIPGRLVWEAYIDRTQSVNYREAKSPDTKAAGLLASARWFGKPDKRGQRFYWSLGWGLQFADETTKDLDSKINSTPMAEFGTTLPFGKQELMVGVRFLHISNAGFVGPNQGSNQLFLTAGVRF